MGSTCAVVGPPLNLSRTSHDPMVEDCRTSHDPMVEDLRVMWRDVVAEFGWAFNKYR
jgi:hypothetical protein